MPKKRPRPGASCAGTVPSRLRPSGAQPDSSISRAETAPACASYGGWIDGKTGGAIDRGELYTAEEVFFTGTASEVEPILEIDGRKIRDGEPGKVTVQLKAAYSQAVKGESKKHADWVTRVYAKAR